MVLLTQDGTLYLEGAAAISSHPWISWMVTILRQLLDLRSEPRFLAFCRLLGDE